MNEVFTEGNPMSTDFYITTVNGYKKYIGKLNKSDRTFRKDLQAQHRFQKAGCLGIDVDLLRHLDRLKCEKVQFNEVATGKKYDIPYELFLTKGFQYPRECNTKAQDKFQPSYMCNEKWFFVSDKDGNLLKIPAQDEPVEEIKEVPTPERLFEV
jgi:hypothetical protein